MTPEQARRVTQVIKNRVDGHEPGSEQWYVDEFVIDCDAGQFWRLVEMALIGAE